jgi:hypothetical protein
VLPLPADELELWLPLDEVTPPCPAAALELEEAPP